MANQIMAILDKLSCRHLPFVMPVNSANCQRSFASEFASFQLSVRNDIESLQNSIELLMSNASTHAHDEPSQAKSTTGKIVEASQTSNKDGNPFTQPQQQYLRNWRHANDPTSAAAHNTPQERSDNEDDVSSVSSSTTLDIYGKSLKRQMTALGKLLIPEPSESLDKATLNVSPGAITSSVSHKVK
mgnify:CR=1 FL=1